MKEKALGLKYPHCLSFMSLSLSDFLGSSDSVNVRNLRADNQAAVFKEASSLLSFSFAFAQAQACLLMYQK